MKKLRENALLIWLSRQFSNETLKLTPLHGDAGFRNYYRFTHQETSYIAVDAHPKTSNNKAFQSIAETLKHNQLQVPEIIAHDVEQGFLCLSDFGERLFSDEITADNMQTQYKKAIDELLKMLTIEQIADYTLPIYDRAFVELELSIFVDWLLNEHLHITLTAEEQSALNRCFSILVDNAIEQPQFFMHRDYHSRNIMVLPTEQLGIIDFQDAVKGPITYDIVSLLRDCYVKWPEQDVNALFDYFCQSANQTLELPSITKAQWQRWFDLMGIQRHVKASGIFARLYHRDNKSGYLNDIPLTLSYIVSVGKAYPELQFLTELVEDKVLPALHELNKELIN